MPDNILGKDFNMMVTSMNKYIGYTGEHVGRIVITINSNGIVTTINSSAEMMLGYEAERFIGKRIRIYPLSPPY